MSADKLLILGLGNTILSDDAIGIVIARKLHELIGPERADFAESSYAGWRLVDVMAGYKKAVIIDSMVGTGEKPGTCCRVDTASNPSFHLRASHGLGINDAIEMARQSGQAMPDEVTVYAVEVKNPYEFGETLTPEVEREIPGIVRQICEEECFLNDQK
jgi:hydrogenase maturation protease